MHPNSYVLGSGTTRVIQLTGTMKMGKSGSDFVVLSTEPQEFSWKGNGRYNWQSHYYSSASAYVYGAVSAGAYVDFYSTDIYQSNAGGKLVLSGDVQFWVWPAEFDINDGSSVPAVDSQYALYPQRMAVIVDGEVVSNAVTGSDGTFSVSAEIPNDDPVTNVGYRFYFDSNAYQYYQDTDGSTYYRYMKFNIFDNGVVDVVAGEGEYTGLLTEIRETVIALPSTIYNFFFGDSGDDAASGFKSEVDSAVSSVDQVQQEITEGLDKPEPEQIVPDITDIVPEEDYATFTDVFAPVMQNQLMISLMMVVVSMAFISYVLFGKKG